MRMVFGSNQRHSSECPSAKLSTQPLLCRVAGKSIQYQSSRPAKANRALSMLFSCSSIKTNAFAGGGSLICEYNANRIDLPHGECGSCTCSLTRSESAESCLHRARSICHSDICKFG